MDAFARSLMTCSLQMLLIITAATAATLLFRVAPPRIRLAYWRVVLLFCLLLPFAPARIIEVDVVGNATVTATLVATTLPTAAWRASLPALIAWLLLAGAGARLVWLAIGVARLHALKRGGTPAVLRGDLLVLQHTFGANADVRWHEQIALPVTYGVRQPVVLLPSRLGRLSLDVQRAVLCHELVHVDRGDWLPTFLEEAVRALFWFHPAVWWVVSRIQLCREETVDALAVAITGSKRAYMQALLAFADAPSQASAPAASFAERHQLVVRIKQLSQEVVMSRTRIACTTAGLLAVLGISGWTAASALPMRSEVRLKSGASHTSAADVRLPAERVAMQSDAQRVVPPAPPPPPPHPPADGKTNPRVLSDVKPPYPQEALPYSPDASVWVAVKIESSGQVSEAKAARWRLSIERSIDDPNYWASKPERAFIEAAEAAAQRWKFAPPDANTRTSIELLFTFRNVPTATLAAAALPPPAAASTNGPKVLRVGNIIKPPQKVGDVKPIYPPSAKAQNIQGVVILEVRIATDGSIADATIARSIPELDDAAVTAVRQWRFAPTLLNGEPVEVLMTVTVNFVL